MDEEIKALSHVPTFKDPKPKNTETCSLISRVCLQQSDDHMGGFIKFDFLRMKVVKECFKFLDKVVVIMIRSYTPSCIRSLALLVNS